MIRNETPCRRHSVASVSPTGPAPTINTGGLSIGSHFSNRAFAESPRRKIIFAMSSPTLNDQWKTFLGLSRIACSAASKVRKYRLLVKVLILDHQPRIAYLV